MLKVKTNLFVFKIYDDNIIAGIVFKRQTCFDFAIIFFSGILCISPSRDKSTFFLFFFSNFRVIISDMCCNSRRKNQTFFYATSLTGLDNNLALPQNSQHSTAQHSTAQHSTAQHSTAQH